MKAEKVNKLNSKDRCEKLEQTLELEREQRKKELEKWNSNFESLKQESVKLILMGQERMMRESFSEGYLLPDVKYKLCASRPLTAKDIDILIEKLAFDKKIILETTNPQ